MVDRIAAIARGTERKISYLVAGGFAASLYLAWELYSVDSALWWNAIKCGLVLLPALIWVFVWFVLRQLGDAPEAVSRMATAEDGLVANVKMLTEERPKGLRGVFRTLRVIQQEEAFSVVFDTIGGITLLANPIFALVAFIAAAILLLLFIIAVLLIVF